MVCVCGDVAAPDEFAVMSTTPGWVELVVDSKLAEAFAIAGWDTPEDVAFVMAGILLLALECVVTLNVAAGAGVCIALTELLFATCTVPAPEDATAMFG